MIAIALPSRGLIFTEVMKSIEEARQAFDIKIFYSSDLGIPDAQNKLTEDILKEKNLEAIWYIEEDTVLPEGALGKLLAEKGDIAFIDYAVNGWSCSAKDNTGTILWCGFGCTLVKAEVFAKLKTPYFRTDKTLRLNDWTWNDRPSKYGGQDIWFCQKAIEAGFSIKQVKGECRHLQIKALGLKEINNGQHFISQKEPIINQQIIDKPLTTNEYLVHNDFIGNLTH